MMKRSKDAEKGKSDAADHEKDEREAGAESAGTIESDGTEPGGDKAATAAAELTKLQEQIVEKDKEIAELKDRYLRNLAESDNIRKRLRQQSEESVRLQREGLLRELLPIVDNLERAVGAARDGGNGKSIVEGVEMVLQSLLDFLRTQGVTQLSAVGQPFDPSVHEAVDQVETAAHPPNIVVNEFNRGYLVGDRMLRPARVTVSRTPKGEDGADSGSNGNDIENN